MAAALVLIDIQTGFDAPVWGARNNPDAEAKAGALLAHWRASGAPIVHIRHVSREPGSPLGPDAGGTAFKAEVAPLPGETVLEKSVNSAFIGTGLEDVKQLLGHSSIVLTSNTYGHVLEQRQLEMAAGMDAVLGG